MQVNKGNKELHIPVNNAGVSDMKKHFTSDNVGGIAQVVNLVPIPYTSRSHKCGNLWHAAGNIEQSKVDFLILHKFAKYTKYRNYFINPSLSNSHGWLID
jgi:hypothetical protein